MRINREIILTKCNSHCGYCGCPVDLKSMQVDHIEPKCSFNHYHPGEEVNHITNLMPSCAVCNHYKRSLGLPQWRKYMLKFHKRLARLPKKTMSAKTERRVQYMWAIAFKYGIEISKPFCGIFYFETLPWQAPKTINEVYEDAGVILPEDKKVYNLLNKKR